MVCLLGDKAPFNCAILSTRLTLSTWEQTAARAVGFGEVEAKDSQGGWCRRDRILHDHLPIGNWTMAAPCHSLPFSAMGVSFAFLKDRGWIVQSPRGRRSEKCVELYCWYLAVRVNDTYTARRGSFLGAIMLVRETFGRTRTEPLVTGEILARINRALSSNEWSTVNRLRVAKRQSTPPSTTFLILYPLLHMPRRTDTTPLPR